MGKHFRGFATANAVKIARIVGDILDLQRIELETERLEVVIRFFDQTSGELQAIVIDFFRCERGQHAAKVSFQRVFSDFVNFPHGLSEKALDGVAKGRFTAVYLDVCDSLHFEGNTSQRIGVHHTQVEWNCFKRHSGGFFYQGNAHGASATDEAIANISPVGHAAFASRKHDDFVWVTDQQ